MPRNLNASTDEADRTFGPIPISSGPCYLEVKANTGAVNVEVLHSKDPDVWLLVEQFSSDTVRYIQLSGAQKVRLTATDDATFTFIMH